MSVYGCVCRQAPTGQRPSASQRWPQVNCLLSFAAPPCRTSVCTCTTMQDKCLHIHNRAGQVSAHAQPCRTSVCTCTSVCICRLHTRWQAKTWQRTPGDKPKLDIQSWRPRSLCGGRKRLLYIHLVSTAMVRQLLEKQLRGQAVVGEAAPWLASTRMAASSGWHWQWSPQHDRYQGNALNSFPEL